MPPLSIAVHATAERSACRARAPAAASARGCPPSHTKSSAAALMTQETRPSVVACDRLHFMVDVRASQRRRRPRRRPRLPPQSPACSSTRARARRAISHARASSPSTNRARPLPQLIVGAGRARHVVNRAARAASPRARRSRAPAARRDEPAHRSASTRHRRSTPSCNSAPRPRRRNAPGNVEHERGARSRGGSEPRAESAQRGRVERASDAALSSASRRAGVARPPQRTRAPGARGPPRRVDAAPAISSSSARALARRSPRNNLAP